MHAGWAWPIRISTSTTRDGSHCESPLDGRLLAAALLILHGRRRRCGGMGAGRGRAAAFRASPPPPCEPPRDGGLRARGKARHRRGEFRAARRRAPRQGRRLRAPGAQRIALADQLDERCGERKGDARAAEAARSSMPHSRHGGDANVLPQDAEGSYGACDGGMVLEARRFRRRASRSARMARQAAAALPRSRRDAGLAHRLSFQDHRLRSGTGGRRPPQGAQRRDRRAFAPRAARRRLRLFREARIQERPSRDFLALLARPRDRLLRRVVQGPGAPHQDERSFHHLPHGALHQGKDRPLARTDRYAPRHQGPALPARLARQRRHDEPQQL